MTQLSGIVQEIYGLFQREKSEQETFQQKEKINPINHDVYRQITVWAS
jgi:hypothetical protein